MDHQASPRTNRAGRRAAAGEKEREPAPLPSVERPVPVGPRPPTMPVVVGEAKVGVPLVVVVVPGGLLVLEVGVVELEGRKKRKTSTVT